MMESIFRQIASLENETVRQWRGGGGKILGYACLLTPVEIIEAAGLLPCRIRGLAEARTDLADARMSRFNCSFCRSCLQLGLEGAYDFLDGLVETNGCDQLRGMFENWSYTVALPFFHYLKVPHLRRADALDYYTAELRRFAAALEKHFAVAVTDEKLRAALAAQAAVRERLRALARLRERDRPAISGAEMLAVVLAGATMPAAAFTAELDRLLAARSGASLPQGRARLLLGGSATDEIDFVREIESLGGMVVADTLCFGSRAFWPQAEESGDDPYASLASLYLNNALCPRMYEEFPARLAYLRETARRAAIDGVVLVHNKFCDVHGFDNTLLRLRLEESGMPVLHLEKEYGAQADLGRLRTRVQAFLERIGQRR